jgi:hypothetical protein
MGKMIEGPGGRRRPRIEWEKHNRKRREKKRRLGRRRLGWRRQESIPDQADAAWRLEVKLGIRKRRRIFFEKLEKFKFY